MTKITNCTPFAAKLISVFDEKSRQVYVVAVSATFQAKAGGLLAVADEQLSVRDSDVYRGEPGLSSVLYEGEIAWRKPRVDVILNASAYAPVARQVTSVQVSLQIGDVSKELLVTGDRFWRFAPAGRRPSSPKLFERMPIVYERSFGGTTSAAIGRADVRNPVGVGFHGAISAAVDVETELPNVEYGHEAMRAASDIPRPAGLAGLSRGWQPRQAFGGTYDAEWLARDSPLLPRDFDAQHFQVAPLDQQSTNISGGERVALRNMTPDGDWTFVLPRLRFPVRLRYADRLTTVPFNLDLVLIEPDVRRTALIGRAAIPMLRNRAPLEEVIIGDVSPGWLHARRARKPYWGPNPDKGGGGTKINFSL
jgi:hypothetical protein